jgi:putative ABC transport system permease protein
MAITTIASAMFKNYLKIALRSFWRSKGISTINILGLSLGLSVCMIIALFVIHERSYDRHYPNAGNIYRIKTEVLFGGNHYLMTYAPAPMAEALAAELPEVQASVHFRERGSFLVKREADNIKENSLIYASKDFFKVFDIPLVEGNLNEVLSQPNTMAISQSVALKYFPEGTAVGKSLILDNKTDYKITAVYEDMPANSHFYFDFLLAAEGLEEAKEPNWLSNNFITYLLLQDDTDIPAFEKKMESMLEKHLEPAMKMVMGESFTMEEFRASGSSWAYTLQPLLDIHLKSDLVGEFKPNFNEAYIYIFVAIALFILTIACINFMNLATARSANRAKEVGVRKVMGSDRNSLIRQFMVETILMGVISMFLAVLIAASFLPYFNQLAERQLEIPFENPFFYLSLIGGALFIGFLAGTYPSFFLSAFNPAKVLKGKIALGMKSGKIRSSLVVFQFAVSIMLIIATFVVQGQLNYIQNKQLGFSKEQVIMVDDLYALGTQVQTFKDEVQRNSLIKSATLSGYLPVSNTWRSDNPWWTEGNNPQDPENLVSIQNWAVDHDYISTLGMKILQGRDFSREFVSDSNAVILNESALKNFRIEGDPIGKRIATWGGGASGSFDLEDLNYKTIIGVVENFHFESLKENVGSVMLFIGKKPQGFASFKFEAKNADEVITLIENQWKSMAPGQPFTYSFLDDRFNKMYAAEARIGKVFALFTSLAVFIACLGLFSLTTFTAEQRTKEIGIRKALGASVANIVLLLSKEYTRLVLFAFLLACPIAWWAMNGWLENYQFKISLGWEIFVLAGLSVFAIAWLTMGFQSVKAAMANPINSLKSE